MKTRSDSKLLAAALAALLCLAARAQQPGRPCLNPPLHAGPPKAEHAATNRAFQGISSMAVSPGGRLWVVCYAGVTPAEDKNNYAVLATSGDDGKTWEDALVIDPDGPGPVRAFDPELWLAPDGRLRVFWAQAVNHDGTESGTWMMETDAPDSARPAWSAPRRLADGVMMCKPLALSSGEWALPVSTWRKTDHSAKMVVSADQGREWSVRGACHVPEEARNYDEHMLVERRDGTLWM
ncbi:MAG: glycoside hydrolase, partial [Opitutaceae bacterium]|nr:glycoside hydrolase [Opitutaceae bacterium]